MRRAWASFEAVNIDGAPWVSQWNNDREDYPYPNYFLFNEIGAQIYRMSKGKICNREPKGYKKHYKFYQCQQPHLTD